MSNNPLTNQPEQSREHAAVTAEEAQALIRSGALLLDVREDDEWDAGHAPGATHIAMGQILERRADIPSDRTIVCVCKVGGRSRAVAEALARDGVDVRNLDGGMLAWESAGLPVVVEGGNTGQVI